MVMSEQENSSQIQAAEKLETAATELAGELQEILKPSDVSALLLSLGSAQSTLDTVYLRLAQWHGQATAGVHHAGDERGNPDNPATVRAEIALREAAQYGSDAAAALARAHAANDVMLWFDEIRVSGDR
jgi:hypothetical protein